jgi:hypothetical protein
MVQIEVYLRATPRALVWQGKAHAVPHIGEYVAWDEGNRGGYVHSVEHMLAGGEQPETIVVVTLRS